MLAQVSERLPRLPSQIQIGAGLSEVLVLVYTDFSGLLIRNLIEVTIYCGYIVTNIFNLNSSPVLGV